MAEEGTLGLARAQEQSSEDLSKEELQRRLDDARGSISNTVTEIKETVANQVQAVKDTLDWREQFKKRPVAWTAGAAGVGFLTGYCIAATIKGDGRDDERLYQPESLLSRGYAAQPIIGQIAPESDTKAQTSGNGHDESKGPGLLHRLADTPAYEKVKSEAGSVAETLLQELGKTAKLVVVPALIKSVKNFLGSHLSGAESSDANNRPGSTMNRASNPPASRTDSGYQPVLERNQS